MLSLAPIAQGGSLGIMPKAYVVYSITITGAYENTQESIDILGVFTDESKLIQFLVSQCARDINVKVKAVVLNGEAERA